MRTADYTNGSADVMREDVNSQNDLGTTAQADDVQGTTEVVKRGRGRPKGATSSTLAEVREQAAEEKRKLRDELTNKINQLRLQLEETEDRYRQDVRELREALRASEQREAFCRSALEERLMVVAEHIHKSLTDWAAAELEEGQITQRKRGRPRKTFK
ncbi:MAG: DNA-binding protein [Thiothrix sp.]